MRVYIEVCVGVGERERESKRVTDKRLIDTVRAQKKPSKALL